MLFDFDLRVPAGTLRVNPASIEARLVKGTLRHVGLFFPPGCASMVDVIVRDQLNQIAPANPSGSFNADDSTIEFDMNFTLESTAHPLIVEGWGQYCRYPHTIIARFDVTPDGEDDQEALAAYLAEVLLPKEG